MLICIEAFGHVLQIEAGHIEEPPPEVSDMPQPMVVPAEVGFTIRPEADEYLHLPRVRSRVGCAEPPGIRGR